jgi:hypothetical protein
VGREISALTNVIKTKKNSHMDGEDHCHVTSFLPVLFSCSHLVYEYVNQFKTLLVSEVIALLTLPAFLSKEELEI